jgi:hypothetical protein
MNRLNRAKTFGWEASINYISVFNPKISESRVKIRHKKTILLKSAQFMFKLKPISSVLLVVDFLQVSQHLSCSLRGLKVQDDVRFDRS